MLLKNRGVRQCATARGVAQIENHVWSLEELVGLLDSKALQTAA